MAAPNKPSSSPFHHALFELRRGPYTHTQIGGTVADAVLLATMNKDMAGVSSVNSSIAIIVSKHALDIPPQRPPTYVEGHAINAHEPDVTIQCSPCEAEHAARKALAEDAGLDKPALLFLYVKDDDKGQTFLRCTTLGGLAKRGLPLHNMRVVHAEAQPDTFLKRMLDQAIKGASDDGGPHFSVVRKRTIADPPQPFWPDDDEDIRYREQE